MSNTLNTQSISHYKRIDYLDLLKGFAILWIIWYHQPHPAIVDHYYHVPLFFFISGIVFKHKDLKTFLSGLWHRLIIPFLFFYTLSYCFQITRFLFENSTFTGFEWNQILDVFKIEKYIDHLRVNRPLWFLLSLVVVQIIYYAVCKLPKCFILLFCLTIIILKDPILNTKSPLMLNQSIYWLGYFAMGDILGKWLVFNHKSKKWRIIAILICFALYVFSDFCNPHISSTVLSNVIYELKVFAFIVLTLLSFSFIKGHNVIVNTLRFFGKNSLSVLGLHLLILIVFGGIAFRIFGLTGDNLIGFAIFVLTAATLNPIILLLNRYMPFLIGGRNK